LTVHIKFIGSFRNVSGRNKLSLRLERSVPFKDVMEKVLKELPELEKLLGSGECEVSRRSVLVLVNGRELSVLQGLKTMIKIGDELVFVPIVHGG
jgi:molybdopterin converting factor small subunit